MFEPIEILITVKAYPAISQKYGEVVCVAGVRTDTETPEWVRLYPVPHRDMPFDQRFKKYDIIRVDAERHASDTRPETYRPNVDTVQVIDHLDPDKTWSKRRPFVEPLIVPSMCELLEREKQDRTSLGVFRPGRVDELTIDDEEAKWDPKKRGIVDQPSLFFADKQGLEKIPYRFRYHYHCDDPRCKNGHHQSIIDWELAQSFRSWREKYDATTLLEKIQERWLGQMCGDGKDTMLFVGNQHRYHDKFLVLGVFWPSKPKT
jgi:hypothetical protein